MRLSIQPLDLPPNPKQLLQIIDQLGSEDLLLYASDYPHQHAADPQADLFPHLPASLAQKIRHSNAQAFYNLH
jgi:predicted TIM-barrel fold metal-dependent hydrolase